jgi:hemolysin activation/secretion protein
MSVLYGVVSDSDTAFCEGFTTAGKGKIVGYREIIPLPRLEAYAHNLSIGVDYKEFEETLEYGDYSETVPVTYMPLTFSYSASLGDKSGVTHFSAGLDLAFRGMVSSESEFEDKRFNARGNYVIFRAGLEREQNLPLGMRVLTKVNGQLADQPLISNEQYSAGGMMSVHGFKESEVSGDSAIHANVILASPDFSKWLGFDDRLSMGLNAYYDAAHLTKLDPLEGEAQDVTIRGTGLGLRAAWNNRIEAALDWGLALDSTNNTEIGDSLVYFLVKVQF